MKLVRLVYASRATAEFQPSSIQSILTAAQKNNRQNLITGLLCFNQHCFLQCLEGPRFKVNQTYQRILNDPRHDGVEIISYDDISDREFSRWDMGYLQDNPGIREIIQHHTGMKEFQPLRIDKFAALALLRDIRDMIEAMMKE